MVFRYSAKSVDSCLRVVLAQFESQPLLSSYYLPRFSLSRNYSVRRTLPSASERTEVPGTQSDTCWFTKGRVSALLLFLQLLDGASQPLLLNGGSEAISAVGPPHFMFMALSTAGHCTEEPLAAALCRRSSRGTDLDTVKSNCKESPR